MPSFVYKSKIVSSSRRALSSQETNIFPRASRGGNSFSKTRAAFDITLECGDNPLLPSDCKYRRICTESSVKLNCKESVASRQPFRRKRDARASTCVYAHAIAIAIDKLLVAEPRIRDNRISLQTTPKSLRFLAHTPFSTLSPFSITEPTTFGIQSVCMSFLWIILAVYQSRADDTAATRIIGRERCGIENC